MNARRSAWPSAVAPCALHHRAASSLWEAACRAVQDPGVLPAAADRDRQGHRRVLAAAAVAIRWITLWTTLVGFGMAVVLRPAARPRDRLARASIYAGHLSADDRLQRHPEGRGGADPGAVVRHRLHPGGADRVPDLVLPDRRQRRDRARHHRAGARGRAEGARRLASSTSCARSASRARCPTSSAR